MLTLNEQFLGEQKFLAQIIKEHYDRDVVVRLQRDLMMDCIEVIIRDKIDKSMRGVKIPNEQFYNQSSKESANIIVKAVKMLLDYPDGTRFNPNEEYNTPDDLFEECRKVDV
jgi:hypothetical protein